MKLSVSQQKLLAKLAIVGILLGFGILLYLPADFFDEGQSICVSVLLFDVQCYGCGMTRAIQHLIHGDVHAAYHFNILSFIVLPLALFLIISKIYEILKKPEAV